MSWTARSAGICAGFNPHTGYDRSSLQASSFVPVVLTHRSGLSCNLLPKRVPASLRYSPSLRTWFQALSGSTLRDPFGRAQSIVGPTGANGTNPERNGVSRKLLLSGV